MMRSVAADSPATMNLREQSDDELRWIIFRRAILRHPGWEDAHAEWARRLETRHQLWLITPPPEPKEMPTYLLAGPVNIHGEPMPF